MCSLESWTNFSLFRLINGKHKHLDVCLELELLKPVTSAKVAFSKRELQLNQMEMFFSITDSGLYMQYQLARKCLTEALILGSIIPSVILNYLYAK